MKLRYLALLAVLSTSATAAPVHRLADTPNGTLSTADMLDPKYMPPKCGRKTCVLTGPGGIVFFWTYHVEQNAKLGKTFVVKGKCQSACYIAYQEAVKLGAKVRIAPGASFWEHKPTRLRK